MPANEIFKVRRRNCLFNLLNTHLIPTAKECIFLEIPAPEGAITGWHGGSIEVITNYLEPGDLNLLLQMGRALNSLLIYQDNEIN